MWTIIIWAASALVVLPIAAAQPADPAGSVPSDTVGVAAKGELGEAYVDGSFGFSVRPLAGSTIHRRKRTVEGDLQLCQFVMLEQRWSMSVRLASRPRSLDAESMLKEDNAQLALRYGDLETLRFEPTRVFGREAARSEVRFTSEQQAWLRQEAVIRTRPTEFFILLLVTPAADHDVARSCFEQIVQSFQVLRSEAVQQEIDAALARGTALLQSAAAGQPDITAGVSPERYLRIMRDGKDVGFVETLEAAEAVRHHEGIQLLQRVWMFEDDGSFKLMQEREFLSRDLSYEQWENRVYVVQQTKGQPPRVAMSGENGIRQDDQLLVEYLPKSKSGKDAEKAIEVEPSYASGSWGTLLPRVVDLSKPELYAFSMYDGDRRGLVLRTFRVVGPTQTVIAGRTTTAYRIEDSEGLVPPVTEVYVDKSGHILRISAEAIEMMAATRAEVEVIYRERVEQSQALLQQLAKEAVAPTDGRSRQAAPVSPRRP